MVAFILKLLVIKLSDELHHLGGIYRLGKYHCSFLNVYSQRNNFAMIHQRGSCVKRKAEHKEVMFIGHVLSCEMTKRVSHTASRCVVSPFFVQIVIGNMCHNSEVELQVLLAGRLICIYICSSILRRMFFATLI